MNRRTEDLWNGVLAELLPPDAAVRSLEAMLREVSRQQRRRRTCRRLSVVVPLLMLAAWTALRSLPPAVPLTSSHEPPPERGLQSAGSHAGQRTSLRAEARAPHRFMATEQVQTEQAATQAVASRPHRSDPVLMLATRPLPASQIVSTDRMTSHVKIVETAAGVTTTLPSAPSPTAWVTTAGETERALLLDDEGLLALLAGRSAALVGVGSGTRIVLADTEARTSGL